MQALTPHAYAQVARGALGPRDRHDAPARESESHRVSRHMPYSKDLQWLSGEAAYQNSYIN